MGVSLKHLSENQQRGAGFLLFWVCGVWCVCVWGGGYSFKLPTRVARCLHVAADCNNEMTDCYANIGHSYSSNGRGYHTTSAKSYVAGDYGWNHKSDGGSYKMVYEVYITG